MACYLTAPSHYLNQCWLFISEALAFTWELFHGECPSYYYLDGLVQGRRNSIASVLELCLSCTNPSMYHKFEYNTLRITATCPGVTGLIHCHTYNDTNVMKKEDTIIIIMIIKISILISPNFTHVVTALLSQHVLVFVVWTEQQKCNDCKTLLTSYINRKLSSTWVHEWYICQKSIFTIDSCISWISWRSPLTKKDYGIWVRAWISNYIHSKQWYVITHWCPYSNLS